MVIATFITYYRRHPLIVCNKVFASALDTSVQGLWAAAPKAEWRPRRQAAIWCDRRALAWGCHSAPLCSPPSVRTKQPLVSLDQPGGQWVLGHLTASWALRQFQLSVIGAKYIARVHNSLTPTNLVTGPAWWSVAGYILGTAWASTYIQDDG